MGPKGWQHFGLPFALKVSGIPSMCSLVLLLGILASLKKSFTEEQWEKRRKSDVIRACALVLVQVLLLFLGFFHNTLLSNSFLPKRVSQDCDRCDNESRNAVDLFFS